VQRGRALLALGNLWGYYHANFQEQEKSVREGLEICQEQGDHFGQGHAYLLLGEIASSYYKDYSRAKEYFDTSLQIYRATGNRWYEGNALLWYAITLLDPKAISWLPGVILKKACKSTSKSETIARRPYVSFICQSL
jgi:tetratricopeptide (TPR) repeat protein